MATANLKFHKVSTLPASCALGDVYYVVGKGIYVCGCIDRIYLGL